MRDGKNDEVADAELSGDLHSEEHIRGLAPGLVVATFCEALGAWAAAIVVHVNEGRPYMDTVSVLDLDWHGASRPALADLAKAKPLRLTHHSWNGKLSYCNHDALLPRNYVVVGRVATPELAVSSSFTPLWRVGQQLAWQLQWDRGARGPQADAGSLKCTVPDLLAERGVRPDVWSLNVEEIDSLDCSEVVRRFPNVTHLTLGGCLGTLTNADALNELVRLKVLSIGDLFGMKGSDALEVRGDTLVESILLHNIPAEYAAATRKAWKNEEKNGTKLHISGARKPEWVAENRDNPLREWDGRPHISAARYAKALKQYKETRRAVMAEIANTQGKPRTEVLVQIGRHYGEAFNRLDGRSPFIETVEREELFAAIGQMVEDAPTLSAKEAGPVRDAIASGLDEVRDW